MPLEVCIIINKWNSRKKQCGTIKPSHHLFISDNRMALSLNSKKIRLKQSLFFYVINWSQLTQKFDTHKNYPWKKTTVKHQKCVPYTENDFTHVVMQVKCFQWQLNAWIDLSTKGQRRLWQEDRNMSSRYCWKGNSFFKSKAYSGGWIQ